jgi:tRNA nucleotidyltransferase (CCA-adding enzyme)
MGEQINLAWQIEQYLPPQLLQLVKHISMEAEQLGQRVYLVGGVVRDTLLGYPNFDLDLVVEGDALKLAEQIADCFVSLAMTLTNQVKLVKHSRFNTAKLSYGNFSLDLAAARRETYSRPGALPTVTLSTISDDLFRRDFSVNAMAVSLSPDRYGELLDPYHGRSDLERCLIRILHPQSFQDDATRILRAIRYEQRLGFKLEPETARILKRDIAMLDTISGDRIRHELDLILKEKYPEKMIKRLGELGVLQRINLHLKSDAWITEKFNQARQLSRRSQLSSLYLCLLLYPLSEEELVNILLRLNVPLKLSRMLGDTLHIKGQLYSLDKPLKNSAIYYLLRDYDSLAIHANFIASESPLICHHLQLFLTKLRYIKPLLNGKELESLGIAPGPEMGKILEVLRQARLNGEAKTKEEEEKLVLLWKPDG